MKIQTYVMLLLTFVFYNALGQGGFIENQKMVAGDRNPMGFFGESIKQTDEYLFVSAIGNDSIQSNSGAVYVFEKMSGEWQETTMIIPDDIGFNDQFGNAIAFENNTLVIASNFHDFGPIPANGGAVYIYENNAGDWTFQQKVVSDDILATDLFGSSIAISGDYLVVGAPRHDYDLNVENFFSESGAIYIFKKEAGTYNQISKLIAPTRSSGERFGFSLAISGNDLLVGAYRDDEDENEMGFLDDAGSVYFYRNDGTDNFNLIQKIVASDRALTDANFGEHLILDGDRLFIRGKTANNRGGVYVFEKNSGVWQEQQIIESDVESSVVANGFALTMDVEGNKLLVGSRNENNVDDIPTGVVKYYVNNGVTWDYVQTFSPVNLQSSDLFGYALDIHNGELVIGAKQQDFDTNEANELTNAGAAYTFTFDPNLVLSTNNVLKPQIKYYPNPINDILNLDFGEYNETVNIEVYDVMGKQVLSYDFKHVRTLQLPLKLSSGTYLAKIITNHEAITVLKLFRQ